MSLAQLIGGFAAGEGFKRTPIGERMMGILDIAMNGLQEGAPVEDRNPPPTATTQARPDTANRNPMVPIDQAPVATDPMNQGINQDMAGFAQQQPDFKQVVAQRAQQLMQDVDPEKAKDQDPAEVQNAAVALATAEGSSILANDPDQDAVQSTLKKAFGNEEMWLTLAMGFNGMRMRPDATLGAALADRLKTIRASKGANQTIAALRAKGVDEATLASLQQSPELLKAVATKVFTKGFADSSAEQRFFEELTKDLSPEEKREAIDIKLGRKPRAGSQYAQTLEQMLIWEKTKAMGKASGKSEAEQEETARKNARAFDVYQSGITGLEQDLLGTSTGYFQGMLPAITSSQQKADMAINRMAPLLKNIFRESGEGVFTDKDQELLIGMIPTRGTNPEVIASSIKAINDIVRLKLGASAEGKPEPTDQQPKQRIRYDSQGNRI